MQWGARVSAGARKRGSELYGKPDEGTDKMLEAPLQDCYPDESVRT